MNKYQTLVFYIIIIPPYSAIMSLGPDVGFLLLRMKTCVFLLWCNENEIMKTCTHIDAANSLSTHWLLTPQNSWILERQQAHHHHHNCVKPYYQVINYLYRQNYLFLIFSPPFHPWPAHRIDDQTLTADHYDCFYHGEREKEKRLWNTEYFQLLCLCTI